MNKLIDKHHRVHNYLRVSLTDNCNFRCAYCMPNETIERLPHKDLMQAEEIYQIAKTFVAHHTNKIRLTGGEPLLRRDFTEIIEKLSRLAIELTLTTNGFLLHKHLDLFKRNGIRSLNISLDSLNADKFKSITQREAFTQVWDNILLFVKEGFHIKLNVVVMKGVNEEEVVDFIHLTKRLPIHVRFIEFMPFDGNQWQNFKVWTMEQMLVDIKNNYLITKLEDFKHDTSKKYKVDGFQGTFAFITTMSQPFCGDCNRMRLTAEGKMKNCLFGKEEYDILSTFRKGEDIEPIIQRCLINKHNRMGGQFEDFQKLNPKDLKNRSMIKIGG